MLQRIKAIIESMGIPFRYGNPSQINYYLNNVDYAAAPDGVAAYCYLLTDSEYVNGKERATIAVFFSKLIDFDFNGSEAISVTDDCKAKAKEFLNQVAIGNSLTYQDARFQYGYNDFAENVAWCAVRAVFEVSEADCWPLPYYRPTEVVINNDWLSYERVDNKIFLTVVIMSDGDVPLDKEVELVIPITGIVRLDVTHLTVEQPPEGYERFSGKIAYVVLYEIPVLSSMGFGFSVTAYVAGVASNVINVWIPQQ